MAHLLQPFRRGRVPPTGGATTPLTIEATARPRSDETEVLSLAEIDVVDPGRRPPAPPAAAPPPADPRVGQIIDRYEVLERIDEGGMGTVYRVRHLRLDKPFAMKVIRRDPRRAREFSARFQREALSLSRLDHPHCVRVVDFGSTGRGEQFMVMELLDGESLADHLGQPMPAARALEIATQLLLGLQHAHAQGIVHRDVKPGNVMLTTGPQGALHVKLLDFGLATLTAAESTRITRTNIVCGTPTYLAPELLEHKQVDQRGDLYAVGVLLFFLLTGRRPFIGADHLELLANKRRHPALRLGQVAPGVFSEQLEQVLARVLDRDPEMRHADAEELLAALEAVQRSPGRGLATASWHQRAFWRFAAARRRMQRAARATALWLQAAVRSLASAVPSAVPRRAGPLQRVWQRSAGSVAMAVALPAATLALLGALDAKPSSGAEALLVEVRQLPGAVTLLPTDPDNVSTQAPASRPAKHAAEPTIPPRIATQRQLAAARAALRRRHCRAAARSLRALLRLQPRLPAAQRLLGDAEVCVGHFRAGLASYRRALAQDPGLRRSRRLRRSISALLFVTTARTAALRLLVARFGRRALPDLLDATTSLSRGFRHRALKAALRLGAGKRIDWVTVLHLDLKQARSCGDRARVLRRLATVRGRRARQLLRHARATLPAECATVARR